jgi:hypothetical protein
MGAPATSPPAAPDSRVRPSGSTLLAATPVQRDLLIVGDHLVGGDDGALADGRLRTGGDADRPAARSVTGPSA